MTGHAEDRQPQPTAADRPQGATAPAEHVVWRMLLRRGIAIAPETALLVAETLRTLDHASPDDAVRTALHADPPARSPRPRRGPATPGAAGCDPLFTEKDARGA
jgi:hypothetical protein